jgi:uncharacterized protein YjbI with pentapeptide repeats
MAPVRGADLTAVQLKPWSEYTDAEQETLRSRWTPEQVEIVIAALKSDSAMPDFVGKLPPPRQGAMAFVDDLRGISVNGVELPGVDLSYKHLQGADFFGAKLEGAILTEANLQGANLRNADLRNAKLEDADLRGASLESAKLNDASLTGANLSHANLLHTSLEGADLTSADLRHASIISANLKRTDLHNVRMSSAVLQQAELQDADVFQVVFDSTYLYQAQLGQAKNIRDIRWGDSLESRYFIGEEIAMKTAEDFRRAEITYRDLKMIYRKELMDDIANEFHFRENEVITKSYPAYSPVRLFRLLFLKWTFGYGSRPVWLAWYSAVVVTGFSLIFAMLTLSRRTQSGICLVPPGQTDQEELLEFRGGLLFLDCFYFSLLSLATFGYGTLQPRQWLQFFRFQPVEYKPIRWACIFVGIEAGLGIWIFSLLVTTLFGSI